MNSIKGLPENSTWNILSGTWLVYHGEERIHIHLKNNGKQLVYVNGLLLSEIRTFKLKSKHEIAISGKSYFINTKPTNVSMASFTTEVRCDENLLTEFTFRYKRDPLAITFLFLSIFLAAIPMVVYKVPNWIFFIVAFALAILTLILFRKRLFVIEEQRNDVEVVWE